MEQRIIQTSFSSIRVSYVEVKEFLKRECWETDLTLDENIEHSLGIAGDDTYELIEKFAATYELNADNVNLHEYFLSEGEQFNAEWGILVILAIPIWIIIYSLWLLSFGRLNYLHLRILPEYGRKTKGMSFADLVIWHLTGNFQPRKEVRFLIGNQS